VADLPAGAGVAVVELSVIIPTRTRQGVLARALAALARQEGIRPAEFEVIVVDDGSTDDTGAVVKELEAGFPWPLRYYRQTPRGPAAARNRGIKEAHGRLVLFLNDDTIAAPDLLARHVDCHAEHPPEHLAVLGLFTWLPELEITPFMRWAERVWFKYDQLLSGRTEPDFTFFFTCNLSLKRSFMLAHGLFDEEFGGPALEDTELGYRLSQQGLRLIFCPEAVGYHDHATDVQAACRRMEMVGRWANLIVQKVPPHLVIDHFWPSIARWPTMDVVIPHFMEPLARRLERRVAIHSLNKLVTTHHFLRGMDKGVPQT
jgi:GT2 family glycosyltransferase